MFMVVLNDGNYLQQTITFVLTFYKMSRNPRTIVCEKKTTKQKKKKQTGSQAKEDDTWQGI